MGFSPLLSNIGALASLGLALTTRSLGDWLENLKLYRSFLTTLLIFGQGRTRLCSAERGEP